MPHRQAQPGSHASLWSRVHAHPESRGTGLSRPVAADWKTRSVFERYAIVSRTDIVDAMRMLQQAEKAIQSAVVTKMVTLTAVQAPPR